MKENYKWMPLETKNTLHYENKSIKIYWKFYHEKMNIFR